MWSCSCRIGLFFVCYLQSTRRGREGSSQEPKCAVVLVNTTTQHTTQVPLRHASPHNNQPACTFLCAAFSPHEKGEVQLTGSPGVLFVLLKTQPPQVPHTRHVRQRTDRRTKRPSAHQVNVQLVLNHSSDKWRCAVKSHKFGMGAKWGPNGIPPEALNFQSVSPSN